MYKLQLVQPDLIWCTLPNDKSLTHTHVMKLIRLLSDNLGPTTLSLTHLFLHPPPHPPLLTHHCHHPSLCRCFTPGSKPSCSTNHFHPRLPSLFRTDSMVSCPAPFLLSISVCFLVFHFTGFSFWFCAVD